MPRLHVSWSFIILSPLPKVIKYVKRSKYSFHDFSAKHTASATLNSNKIYMYFILYIFYLLKMKYIFIR